MDKGVGVGKFCRCNDFFIGGVKFSITDVFHHGCGKQVCILQYDTERVAQVIFFDLVDVDAIVTDHAPHAPEEKDVEFRNAPNGFCGLETSVGVILTELYHTGLFTINEIVDKMSCRPAELFHLDGGTLREGSSANITILDLDKDWVVDSSKFYTRGKVTPFNGKHCKGQAAATMVDGVFVMKDGVVCKK